MLKLKKIAVTGGLASGKSTVCDLFRSFGAEVVSADAVVHQLLSGHPQLIQAVAALLGPDVLTDNVLDRKKIAQAVFNSPKILKSLESLIHPAVRQAIHERYVQACASGQKTLFIAEIPLLFESEQSNDFDKTICVVADENIRKQRYGKRTAGQENDFNQRQQNQWPQEKKAQQADFVIINNGSLEQLQKDVYAVYKLLINP